MPEFTPLDFVSKWKRTTAREKQTYQEHFIDICRLIGQQTPNEADPHGTRYAFEMGAAKTSGGDGWADVAKLGYFGWEYKGKQHANLDKAYEQLLLYRDSLQNPPLLIVSDINRIIIRTNYTNLPTTRIDLTLEDFLKPDCLQILRDVFTNPEHFKPQKTVEKVTEEAAMHFSRLAANLRKYEYDNQEIAHFLIRLLFCLFAEDIGLLPERLFPHLLDQTRHNAKDFAEVLRQLFHAMNHGGYFGPDKILYFNGGLFDDEKVLEIDSADMDILADIDALDWSAIKPSIFGTLFERGLDPSKRSQLGAHYTSEDDIRLIVEPVLMQPLRRDWETIKTAVRQMKLEEEQAKPRKRAVLQKAIQYDLFRFADKIATVQVLDPACGSGNFLYVALRLLLDLQNQVYAFADEMGAGRQFVTVTPSQLHGIEINEYAHELAHVTIQIGYIQWLRDNGYGVPKEPILKPGDAIMHMDAILAYDADGKPVEPVWPAVDVIVSNPPFLGDKKMRAQLGDKYVDDLRQLYGDRIPGQSDLVCYWFEKARAMIEAQKVKRAGLLATQGIRGGANRRVLERIKETGDIFWAQSDRDWILDGAAVNVSMVGFCNNREAYFELDGHIVGGINPDLTGSFDLTLAKGLSENMGLSFIGPSPHGAFDIDADLANQMLQATNNPNGRSNRDVVKPVISGTDLVEYHRNLWTVDFGLMSVQEASQYEMPFEYVKKMVYPVRIKNRRVAYAEKWWQYAEARPGMRAALEGKKRYIATPRVAKHRIFSWVGGETLANDGTTVIASESLPLLGVLQSRLHAVWAVKRGTFLESRPRYTPTTTFETFPFPWPPSKEPKGESRVEAIAQAAKELVEQRDRWLNAEGLGEAEKKKRTLTNLYNARPTWLDLAHKRLDEAVFAAYGWSPELSDEEILAKLLALNLERAGKQ